MFRAKTELKASAKFDVFLKFVVTSMVNMERKFGFWDSL